MVRRPPNSILESLKGKIWVATGVLAFFVCTFGIVAYLLASFVVSETFYAIAIPFLLVSTIVVIFGWWLSNEVIKPIEKIALLARSLERNSSTSLPKTTGATETDEILQTLHRNSQQLQTIVGLMEDVAGGNLNVVLTPLGSSDRLSASFQKLLSRVSDSIHAKQELEQMEDAVQQLKTDIALVRSGNLNKEISVNHPQTREISETLNFLTAQLNNLILQVNFNSSQARNTNDEMRKQLRIVERDEERKIAALGQMSQMLKKMPVGVHKFYEDLSVSIIAANQTIEKARLGTIESQHNLNAVGNLRKQLNDATFRIQRLNERSDEITKISKAIGDLANRTNLIALNASIQAADSNEKNSGFSMLAEEVERLSTRAENTNKEISALNKSISLEISDVENSLRAIVSEAAGLSKFSVETGNTLSELERYIVQFLNLQGKLAEYAREQTFESQKSFYIFTETLDLMKKSLADLRTSENANGKLAHLLETMQTTTLRFTLEKPAGAAKFAEITAPKLSAPPVETKPIEEKLPEVPESESVKDLVEAPEPVAS